MPLGKKKNKSKKTKSYNLSSYVIQNNKYQYNLLDEVSPEDIHLLASKVFGNSYYIDYKSLTNN